ncbi:MAG TPA: hypothetical protein VGU43_02565 [Thermoplasmata archaeon]|nr:hypothetical protein [Thermoplasmata archaeon]
MQALSLRDSASRRRSRVECPRCSRPVDLQRLRAHLRDLHRLDSAELDKILVEVRRLAIRGRGRRIRPEPRPE